MVIPIEKNGKTYFKCAACGFVYEAKEDAQACAEFCQKKGAQ